MKFKIKGIRHYQSEAVMIGTFGISILKMEIGQTIIINNSMGSFEVKRVK